MFLSFIMFGLLSSSLYSWYFFHLQYSSNIIIFIGQLSSSSYTQCFYRLEYSDYWRHSFTQNVSITYNFLTIVLNIVLTTFLSSTIFWQYRHLYRHKVCIAYFIWIFALIFIFTTILFLRIFGLLSSYFYSKHFNRLEYSDYCPHSFTHKVSID